MKISDDVTPREAIMVNPSFVWHFQVLNCPTELHFPDNSNFPIYVPWMFSTMLGGNTSEIGYSVILPYWTEAARNNISLDAFDCNSEEPWLKEIEVVSTRCGLT